MQTPSDSAGFSPRDRERTLLLAALGQKQGLMVVTGATATLAGKTNTFWRWLDRLDRSAGGTEPPAGAPSGAAPA